MTFVLDGCRLSGRLLLESTLTKRGSIHALQALLPLLRRLLLVRGLLRKYCALSRVGKKPGFFFRKTQPGRVLKKKKTQVLLGKMRVVWGKCGFFTIY